MKKSKYTSIITKKFLIQAYIKNRKTMKQITKELNCSFTPIVNRLKEYNIKIRTKSEALKGKNNGNYIDGRCSKKYYCIDCLKIGIKIEIHYDTWKYGQKRCNPCAIKHKWQNEELRKEYSKLLSGKNNPNYKHGGGREPYPLEWTETLKESIRQRDNHQCQLCECSEIENGRKLDVHHIDYNKNNLNPKNLISLCLKCNSKVNGNRDYWYAYFTYLGVIKCN